MTERMPLFLSAPHPPALVARGLYAGLKSRGGLPTPLPVVLASELYVNAGFIDGLSTVLIRSLGLTEVQLRLVAKGPLLLQWYYLDRHGAIRHYLDHVSIPTDPFIPTGQDLPVPPVLLTDSNVSLVFFRISHDAGSNLTDFSELLDWCFHAKHSSSDAIAPLLLVSRSLAESGGLIEQHHNHQLHLADLQRRFPDLRFMPMPHLHLYESDADVYQRSAQRLHDFTAAHPELDGRVALHRNPFNLGGGGNMCLAVKRSVVDLAHKGDFVMLDSDTVVPFKTLYTSALISALTTDDLGAPSVLTPVVAYRKRPTQVLEAGAVFGRGTWQLAVAQALQPCILPLEHGADLSDKHVQARLAQTHSSDYPPFIFSLYRLGEYASSHALLPAPFFLRGDDVEYGFHLRNQGVRTSVLGSLLVFQDPKHSPWHEVMAILHSTVVLMAHTAQADLCLLGDHLYTFFHARFNAHGSLRDLHGISLYQEVLSRLISLLAVPQEKLLSHFYDPDYYLGLRSLNLPYTDLNYDIARSIASTMPKHAYQELPFLYYPQLPKDEPLPDSVFLLNHLAETAAVLNPARIACSELQSARQDFQRDLATLLNSLEPLQQRCLTLLDRDLIADHCDRYSLQHVELEIHQSPTNPSMP